jgi:hypothetical protein
MVDYKRKQIDLGSLARAHSERAIQTLAGLMEKGLEEGTRVRCADILLDRGFGRPKQETTNEVKGELRVIMRKVFNDIDDGSEPEGHP